MKSFVVALVRLPGQRTFAHQRSVIFWSQPSVPMWVLHVKVNYLNYDAVGNIIARCQLPMSLRCGTKSHRCFHHADRWSKVSTSVR
jgi:hypothetical protein